MKALFSQKASLSVTDFCGLLVLKDCGSVFSSYLFPFFSRRSEMLQVLYKLQLTSSFLLHPFFIHGDSNYSVLSLTTKYGVKFKDT